MTAGSPRIEERVNGVVTCVEHFSRFSHYMLDFDGDVLAREPIKHINSLKTV